jgi:hypothetical protein
MQYSLGMSAPIAATARHFAKRAPSSQADAEPGERRPSSGKREAVSDQEGSHGRDELPERIRALS